jgi:hypothetical protein
MTDYIDVVEHNPIVFVKAICEKIVEGYTVHNTIAGYPEFGLYGCRVRLFRERKGVTVVGGVGESNLIEQYDPMSFLLSLEAAVLAGYKLKDKGNHFLQPDGLKSVEMEVVRSEPTTQLTTPAKKAPAKKALKAEPTINEMETE